MPELEVLISCMNLGEDDIVDRSRIYSSALIIDQCQKDELREYYINGQLYRHVCIPQRGLTKSRNLAISLSKGDICLLCDDDEVFCNGYMEEIIKAYSSLPQADVIIFQMENMPNKLGQKIKKLSYLDLLKVSSWQISFLRKRLGSVRFDENMGAGTGNGAEEEFKFLTDCRKAGLKIYYVPVKIARVEQQSSTWFKGYNKVFFVNRGNTTRYIMGPLLAFIYGLYYCFFKRGNWDVPWTRAFGWICEGIRENRLGKLKLGEG